MSGKVPTERVQRRPLGHQHAEGLTRDNSLSKTVSIQTGNHHQCRTRIPSWIKQKKSTVLYLEHNIVHIS